MKKLVFLGTVAVLALCLAGQVQRQAVQTPLTTAMRAVANAEDAKKEFLNQYNRLTDSDARTLLVLYPWLAPTNLLSLIYSPAAETAGAGITAPARSPAPVERLTIAWFAVGTTSFLFKVEWPLNTEFPAGTLDFLTTPDLTLTEWGWSHLADIPVIPAQGYADIEILFEDLPSLYMADIESAKRAFFKLRVSEQEEWWGGGLGDKDEEDDGDPPDDPPPLTEQPARHLFDLDNDAEHTSTLSETVPAIPGMHYLIVVGCWDPDVQALLYPPNTYANTLFSWTITAPGSEPMTGSTDTHALAPLFLETGRSWQHQDFWVVSIPTNATRGNIQVAAAIVPEAIGNLPKRTYIDVVPLELEQRNMPKAVLQDPPGSTDNAGYRPAWITEGKTAYITGQPQPPALWARWCLHARYDHGEAVSVAWRMEVETERPEYRKALDNKVYPKNGGYTPYFNYLNLTEISVSDLMENEMVGGKCTIHYKIKNNKGKEEEHSFKFKIRGMNPPDAVAKDYIDDHVDDAFKPYAWAIFKHETRDGNYVFNQFNARGKYMHLPNRGYPDGWGITQKDRSGDDPPGTVTTAEAYNFRTNTIAGNLTLRDKVTINKSLLRKIEKSYPDEWEPPPATFTFSNAVLSSEQLAVTVLYNGVAGVPPTLVVTNENPKIWAEIRSPLKFNPDEQPGNRWTFHDNRTNYAYKVLQELQGNMPPAKE